MTLKEQCGIGIVGTVVVAVVFVAVGVVVHPPRHGRGTNQVGPIRGPCQASYKRIQGGFIAKQVVALLLLLLMLLQ